MSYFSWKSWAELDENNMKKQTRTVRREILWKSEDGEVCVIKGPFPHGFQRTLTSKTLQHAKQRSRYDIITQRETTDDKAFALTYTRLVEESHNEWGEIGP